MRRFWDDLWNIDPFTGRVMVWVSRIAGLLVMLSIGIEVLLALLTIVLWITSGR